MGQATNPQNSQNSQNNQNNQNQNQNNLQNNFPASDSIIQPQLSQTIPAANNIRNQLAAQQNQSGLSQLPPGTVLRTVDGNLIMHNLRIVDAQGYDLRSNPQFLNRQFQKPNGTSPTDNLTQQQITSQLSQNNGGNNSNNNTMSSNPPSIS